MMYLIADRVKYFRHDEGLMPQPVQWVLHSQLQVAHIVQKQLQPTETVVAQLTPASSLTQQRQQFFALLTQQLSIHCTRSQAAGGSWQAQAWWQPPVAFLLFHTNHPCRTLELARHISAETPVAGRAVCTWAANQEAAADQAAARADTQVATQPQLLLTYLWTPGGASAHTECTIRKTNVWS
jgi:hypothetical protein